MAVDSDVVYEKFKWLDEKLMEQCQEIERKMEKFPFYDDVISKLNGENCINDELEKKCYLAALYGRREAFANVAHELTKIRKELVKK